MVWQKIESTEIYADGDPLNLVEVRPSIPFDQFAGEWRLLRDPATGKMSWFVLVPE